MRREGEVLHYGCGVIASLAARCRSSASDSGYYAGAVLESMFGERRTWDATGQTMFATFPSPWLADQARAYLEEQSK